MYYVELTSFRLSPSFAAMSASVGLLFLTTLLPPNKDSLTV